LHHTTFANNWLFVKNKLFASRLYFLRRLTMSNSSEKSIHPTGVPAESGTQNVPQPPIQNGVVHAEKGDESLILRVKALAIVFIGSLSAVFLVSKVSRYTPGIAADLLSRFS
jgi:hypothetical protein